jgi:hypothetical protein
MSAISRVWEMRAQLAVQKHHTCTSIVGHATTDVYSYCTAGQQPLSRCQPCHRLDKAQAARGAAMPYVAQTTIVRISNIPALVTWAPPTYTAWRFVGQLHAPQSHQGTDGAGETPRSGAVEHTASSTWQRPH